jgi:hypothetical protein
MNWKALSPVLLFTPLKQVVDIGKTLALGLRK